MVRTVAVQADKITVNGDQIEIHADVGPGRIISANLTIDDGVPASTAAGETDPSKMSFEEWEKNFNEMCALAPINEFPADVSRESMYMSDEELGYKQQ
ncbi:MAG TPA: hypothetical protein VM008_15735 [Phycisphaerae bacterium]|nr:hypothetical protein [Phycisphaerae bacterium]